MEYGILSLAPVVIALVLSFITKDALLSILVGVIVGVVITGSDPISGLSGIFQSALGTPDFIWVLCIEVFIGVMVAYFQKSGAIQAFANWIGKFNLSRRMTAGTAWILGLIIFFSDYFSPLYVGNVMRPLTDKARISREKLSFICDCTSAPVACMLGPLSAWGTYMAGLLVGIGVITDVDIAMDTVIRAVPFNFYCIIMVFFCCFNAFGIIPDFGSMRKAEKRALEEGKVVADGSTPLLSKELTNIQPNEGIKPSLFVVCYQFIVMMIQRMATLKEMMETAIEGIKSVMSAILILAMAYCVNNITNTLQAPEYILSITESWMTPALLVTITFIVCAVISFLTGSSWGTWAILTPIVMPLAFSITDGQMDTLIYATVGAIMGGATFGDHCSPLSDTTILSSLGAGSDHIDHTKTQMLYAITCAVLACIITLILGVTVLS